MSGRRKEGFGIRGAQTLPASRIGEGNIAEAVQKLTDLLGAAKLGRESESSVYVCGVLLRNTDKELANLSERIGRLEGKTETEDG